MDFFDMPSNVIPSPMESSILQLPLLTTTFFTKFRLALRTHMRIYPNVTTDLDDFLNEYDSSAVVHDFFFLVNRLSSSLYSANYYLLDSTFLIYSFSSPHFMAYETEAFMFGGAIRTCCCYFASPYTLFLLLRSSTLFLNHLRPTIFHLFSDAVQSIPQPMDCRIKNPLLASFGIEIENEETITIPRVPTLECLARRAYWAAWTRSRGSTHSAALLAQIEGPSPIASRKLVMGYAADPADPIEFPQ